MVMIKIDNKNNDFMSYFVKENLKMSRLHTCRNDENI